MGIPRRIRRLALLTTIAVALPAASAEAYELDPTFGGDGVITTDGGASTGDNFFDVEVLPSGKILAAGRTNTVAGGQDFLLVKYNADGTLDSAFGGGDGIVTTDFGGASEDIAQALDVQSDGKIVLAGDTTANTIGAFDNFAAARYNADGTLDDDSDDAGFGGDGLVTVPVDADDGDEATDVLVDGNGRVVLVGQVYVPGTDEFDFAIARLTSAGALDAAFDGDGGSGNGVVTIDFTGANGDDYALAVALFDDGDLAVAGGAFDTNDDDDSVLVRLNAADGTLDDSFDNDGKVVTAAGDHIDDLAVSTGKVLGVGQNNGNDWSLERYEQSDGSLDESFDGDGLLTTDFPGQTTATAVSVAIDGAKYVVAGDVNLASGGRAIGAARYSGSGGLDSSFGGDGRLVADLVPPPGSENASGVGIVDDGNALTDNKVIVAGDLNLGDDTPTRDAMLMRLAPDETAPQSQITKPDHRKAYRAGRVRTLTGTAVDPNAGSGVDRVELALRRKRTNGSCAWWDGDSFAAGDCNTQAYFDATGAEDWSYTLPSNLKSSVGTKTKNYTLFARARDLAGHIESVSEVGRNQNTFDVR